MTRKTFEDEFITIQSSLKSYLYRITCDKEMTNDLAQDTFLKASGNLLSFKNQSSLKTWIFAIATNLAKDHHRVQKRWRTDAQDQCRSAVESNPVYGQQIQRAFDGLPEKRFEIREHISFCFNCVAKTLHLEEQIAVILADVYDFKRTETANILGKTEGVVKHLLFNGRKSLQEKYAYRCALVNKRGICYQCAELNDHLNPQPDARQQLSALPLTAAPDPSSEKLLQLRTALVKAIDPLQSNGSPLQDTIVQILRKAVE